MLAELFLDARDFVPPEPFDQATGLLRAMLPGQYLRMLHRRVPYPLFDFCRAMHLTYGCVQEGQDCYRILIYFPADEDELRQAGLL